VQEQVRNINVRDRAVRVASYHFRIDATGCRNVSHRRKQGAELIERAEMRWRLQQDVDKSALGFVAFVGCIQEHCPLDTRVECFGLLGNQIVKLG
jgi:hypothetical protein